MSELFPHVHRPAVEADECFIFDPWLKELRHAPFSRFIRSREYVPDQRRLIREILAAAQVTVACAPDDAAHLYGFIAYGPGAVVHWVYVKDAFQRLGIGDGLLRSAFPDLGRETLYATQASSKWKDLEAAIERRGIVYRPHLLLRAS